MFQQSLVGSGPSKRTPWSFAVSLLAQTLAICLVLLATMAYTPLLPAAGFAVWLEAPPPPPGAPPPPPEQVAVVRTPDRYENPYAQPIEIPDDVAMIVDPEDYQSLVPASSGPVIGGDPGGLGDGVIGSLAYEVAPPPPPKPKVVEKKPDPPAPAGPQRVGGDVQAAKLIRRVAPVYPPLAIKTRTSGTVRLSAIISAEGEVEALKVLGGHPLLIPAAVAAVKQWRYRPTFLNGKPTGVITEIEVNFVLK